MKYNNIYYPSKDKSFSKVPLSNIATGFDYGIGASAVPFDGEHKYIRITDIDENNGLYKKGKVVSPEFGTEEKYRVKENDILVARTGASVGKKYIYNKKDGKVYFAGFLIRLNITSVDSKYVFYSMSTNYYKEFITVMSQRSGQPGINAKELAKFKVNCPTDLRLTRKYGALLTSIDNLIEKNQQKNKLLLLHKRRIIIDMFSKEKCMNATNYKLRDICCEMRSGGTPKSSEKEYYNGNIPFMSISDINNNQIRRVKKYITQEALNNSSSKIIPSNNLLYTMYATPGIAFSNEIDVAIPQSIISIELKNKAMNTYVLEYLNFIRNNVLRLAMTGTQSNLTGEIVKNITIPIFSEKEISQIANLLSSMDKLIETEEKKLTQLELMKKYYLQQVFL